MSFVESEHCKSVGLNGFGYCFYFYSFGKKKNCFVLSDFVLNPEPSLITGK